MEDNKPIDGAEYISLEDAKRLKLPYFEGLAAGYPSPAGDYQHESLDLNEKFVHHPEASYFVREVMGKAAIEREQSQACLDSAERKQARTKFKADVFKDSIKHDFRSLCYTTRWSDIPEAT